MNSEHKTISICVPCYNSEKYLLDTLISIKNQTVSVNELILINDGSTDGTEIIIENFIEENKDLKILLFSQDNLGQSVTRNKLMELVNSEYFSFVDSDDILHYQYVEMFQRAIFASDFDVCSNSFCFINEAYVYKKSSFKKYDEINSKPGNKTFDLIKFRNRFISGKSGIAPTTLLFRKSFISQYNLKFNETIRYGEDDLFIIEVLMTANSLYIIPLELYFYRRRLGSITTNPSLIEVGKYKNELFNVFTNCSYFGFNMNDFFSGYIKRFIGLIRMYAKYKNDFEGFLNLISKSNLKTKDILFHQNPLVIMVGISLLISPKLTYRIFKYLPG